VASCSSGSTLFYFGTALIERTVFIISLFIIRRACPIVHEQSLSFTQPIISLNYQPPRRRRTTSSANHHISTLIICIHTNLRAI
jgi:hypothetical protein